MKFLAFSDWRVQDIEQFIDYLERLEEKPDIIVYAGDDIRRFNHVPYMALPKDRRRKYREELIEIQEPFGTFDKNIIEEIIFLNEVEYKNEVNKFEKIASFSRHGLFVVAGNDDPPYCKKAINGEKVFDIHDNPVIIDDFAIIGIEGSTGEIGPFRYTEKEIENHLKTKINQVGDRQLIIVSHSPPFEILDFSIRFGKGHIGSSALRDFIEKNSDKVRAIISGHAHLQGGKHTEFNTTFVVNCASHDNYGTPGRIALIDISDDNVDIAWKTLYGLSMVPLVGEKTELKLRGHGILQVKQLAALCPTNQLYQKFSNIQKNTLYLIINYAKAIDSNKIISKKGINSALGILEGKNIYFFDAEYDSEGTRGGPYGMFLLGWMDSKGKVQQKLLDNTKDEKDMLKNFGQWGLIPSDQLAQFKTLKSKYQLGFKDPNTGTVLADVILNTKEGYILDGRIVLEDGYLHDRGTMWFKQYLADARYLSGRDGKYTLNYCYRNIMYITGRHISPFLQKITYNFISTPAYKPYFKEEGIQKNRIRSLGESVSKDLEFLDHLNYKFILKNAENFIERLSVVVDYYGQTSLEKQFLPIPNYDLRVLGAHKSSDGQLLLGPDYYDVESLFQILIGDYMMQIGGPFDVNQLAQKLCSIKVESGERMSIQNAVFNKEQTRKQWFQDWLDLFKKYQYRSSSSLSLVEQLNKLIVVREKGFQGESFDFNQNDEKFSEEELRLANRVAAVIVELFGRYVFTELYTGGAFLRDGTITFISRPWQVLRSNTIDASIDLKFHYGKWTGSVTKTRAIPNKDASTRYRNRYLLDRFTSALEVKFPTYPGVDSSFSTISIAEVPSRFVLPVYKISSYKGYSDLIYKKFLKYYTLENQQKLKFDWRGALHNTLIKILKDRGYTGSKLSLADSGIKSKLHQALDQTVRDFNLDFFDWLSSRGECSFLFEYGRSGEEFLLTPSDFRKYFKDNWVEFAMSLYQPRVGDLDHWVEKQVRYNQDLIVDILNFIFEMAYGATDKKIALYTFTANRFRDTYGYGVSLDNKYFPHNNPYLGEWDPSWTQAPHTTGFYLDLNDANSIKFFINQIPMLIANLLVKPAAFVVREIRNDPGEVLSERELTFAFDMTGSLTPSQLKKANKKGPPENGMIWSDGTTAEYTQSAYYQRWNEILSRHNILGIHKFADSDRFYDICRQVLFAVSFRFTP